MRELRNLNVVVIGGGTGSFTVLTGLKKYVEHISALVSMADDGGSTGTLRDELGVLPPGDARQCLVALSGSPKMRELLNYRFDEGGLIGHSFGNLFLTALEKMTGSFAEAIKVAGEILDINGHRVIPSTLDKVTLMVDDGEKIIRHERDVVKHHEPAAGCDQVFGFVVHIKDENRSRGAFHSCGIRGKRGTGGCGGRKQEDRGQNGEQGQGFFAGRRQERGDDPRPRQANAQCGPHEPGGGSGEAGRRRRHFRHQYH